MTLDLTINGSGSGDTTVLVACDSTVWRGAKYNGSGLYNLSLKSDAGVVTGNVIHGEGNEPPSICTKVGGVFFIVVNFFQTEASSQLVIHKTLGIS